MKRSKYVGLRQYLVGKPGTFTEVCSINIMGWGIFEDANKPNLDKPTSFRVKVIGTFRVRVRARIKCVLDSFQELLEIMRR